MAGKNPKEQLYNNPFPNDHIDPEEKKDPKFGRKVAAHIYWKAEVEETHRGDRAKIRTNRMYARGRQDKSVYFPKMDREINAKNDLSYLNISWDIDSPMDKITREIVGSLMNNSQRIEFNCIDPISSTEKSKKRDEFFGKLMRTKAAENIEQATGIPLESPIADGDPKDPVEVNMYMDLTHKQASEIGMEELTNWEFENNSWDSVESDLIRDLVENSRAITRTYFDENYRPRLRYVDPEFYISSYVDRGDHSDTEYQGEIRFITIRQLRKIARSTGLLSEKDLFNAAKAAHGKHGNGMGTWMWGPEYNESNTYAGAEYAFDDYRVVVLDFLLYTEDLQNWEWKEGKHKNHYLNRKGYRYQGGEKSKYRKKKISKSIEREYEGIYVAGIDKMAKWSVADNMMYPRKNGSIIGKCIRRYNVYFSGYVYGKTNSIVDLVRSKLDDYHMATLKFRHFMATSRPDGVNIDADAISNVILDNVDMDAHELIKMFEQKGILIYSSRSSVDNEYMNRPPIEERNSQFNQKLLAMLEIKKGILDEIREVTGWNPSVDSTSPDKDMPVGLAKLQVLNANNALREMYEGYKREVYAKTALSVAAMIQRRITYSKEGRKEYEAVCGRMGVKSIEWMDNANILELGAIVEAVPGVEEAEYLANDLRAAVDRKEISPEDAAKLRQVFNTKKAFKMLEMYKRERQKRQLEQQQQQNQMEIERSQAEQQAKSQAEMQFKEFEHSLKMREMMFERETKLLVADKEIEKVRVDSHIDGGYEIDKIREAGKIAKERDKEKASMSTPKEDMVPGMRDPEASTDTIRSAIEP